MHEQECQLFRLAVEELASELEAVDAVRSEVSRRHFRFEGDRYFIESVSRPLYSGATYKRAYLSKDELRRELPAFHECLSRLAAVSPKNEDAENEESSYWQAWIHVRTWIDQCFSQADSLKPSEDLCEAIFRERYESWLHPGKPFLIPVHGLRWSGESASYELSPELQVIKLSDDIKSQGWFDLWVDSVSTNAGDIANCDIALRGATEEARARAVDFLDSLRLLRIGSVFAPDCFWLGHEFGVVGGGLGPVQSYGPIRRPIVERVELTREKLDVAAGLYKRIQCIRRARHYGALETPLSRYRMAMSRFGAPEDGLLDLAISLESLFSSAGGEKAISLRGIAVLAPYIRAEDAATIRKTLKLLKTARDKIAHTGVLSDSTRHNFLADASKTVAEILCAVIDQSSEGNVPADAVASGALERLVSRAFAAQLNSSRNAWWRLVEAHPA